MIKHINSDQRKFDGQFLQWQIFILSTNESKCVDLKCYLNDLRIQFLGVEKFQICN